LIYFSFTQYVSYSFNYFNRLSKRCSQIAVNRVKKFESMAGPKSLRLHEFLKKRNNKSSSQTKINKMVIIEISKDINSSNNYVFTINLRFILILMNQLLNRFLLEALESKSWLKSCQSHKFLQWITH
jgi:hypothetical protein